MRQAFLSRFSDRGPLLERFQRGVRVGFIVTALIAISTLVLTEYISNEVDDTAVAERLLADQRVDVLRLRADIPDLLDARSALAESDLRIEIAERADVISQRQVELTVRRPELGQVEVDVDGEPTPLGDAVREMLETVDRLVDAAAADQPITTIGTLRLRSYNLIETIDAPLAEFLDADDGALREAASTLQRWGRILAAVALFLATMRLFVLGRPLIVQLGEDQRLTRDADELHQLDRHRRDLNARMSEGLESSETEAAVRVVVERSFSAVIGSHPAEMLLADSSKAHLTSTATNPKFESPGCGVTSPWSCPAVRRGSTIIYDDSDGIRACPYLADRPTGRCSAVCVPVAFMGDAMGVLHVTGEVGWNPPSLQTDSLELIAGQTAMRLGQIRSFEKARVQASTDVLTGLSNRRATEEHVGSRLSGGERGAVAIADLDRFKALNDTYGHEAGDRALRMFAEVLGESVREVDWTGRWGGEEFVLYLPSLNASEARDVLERVRENLRERCAHTDGPVVTVSIGVVDTTVSTSLVALVAAADDCLYFAKENGRDQVVVGPVSALTSTEVGS